MKRSTSAIEPCDDPLIDEQVRRGYLEPIKAGRETIYRLTPAGMQHTAGVPVADEPVTTDIHKSAGRI